MTLLCLLLFSNLTLADSYYCGGIGLNNKELIQKEFIQSGQELNCIHTRKIYQCNELEQKLSIEDKNKIIHCDKKSIEVNSLANTQLASCIWNGVKLSGEELIDILNLPILIAKVGLKGFSETADCNTNIEKKRQLLNVFNSSISDKRFQLEEKAWGDKFNDLPCSEIETRLHARLDNYQQQIFREYKTAKDKGENYQFPNELISKNSEVLFKLDQIFRQANISYQCFTPKVKAEFMCMALTNLLTDVVTGVGITKAVTALQKSIKVEQVVLAAEGEMSAHFGLFAPNPYNSLVQSEVQLKGLGVPFEIKSYLEVNVIKVMPNETKNLPDLYKMIKALDDKYGIPTYIDAILLKSRGGAAGVSHHVPNKGTSILLDSDYLRVTSEEDIKFMYAHEAVHATGDKRILSGKASPDNNLKMYFRSTQTSLNENLHPAYSRFFTIEEVKAYFKQKKMLETYLENNRNNLSPDMIKRFEFGIANLNKHTKDMSSASEELLTQVEIFLKNNPANDNQVIKVFPRTSEDSKNVFDVTFSIPRPGKDNIEFAIPIYDQEAGSSGKIKDLNSKILKIIDEAKKTVSYYKDSI